MSVERFTERNTRDGFVRQPSRVTCLLVVEDFLSSRTRVVTVLLVVTTIKITVEDGKWKKYVE